MAEASGMVGSEPKSGANIKPNVPPHAQGQSQPQNNLSPEPPEDKPVSCPECGSGKVWKDGVRYTNCGEIQRYVCRSCGFRFSQTTAELKEKLNIVDQLGGAPNAVSKLSPASMGTADLTLKPALNKPPLPFGEDVSPHANYTDTPTVGQSLNMFHSNNRSCRVCGWKGQPKNSAPKVGRIMENAVENGKWAAGATEKPSEAELQGKIVQFLWWMKKQGYAESTIISRVKILKTLLKKGVDLLDPESVKEAIAKQETWSLGRKELVVEAYSSFLFMLGKTWDPPKYKRIRKLPFIPLESEIDQFIAGCSATKRLMVFLQLLKETGMRCGEALRLEWTDIDFATNTIRVSPEKDGDPRLLKISNKLVAMLNELPKESRRVFPVTYDAMRKSFNRQRKRLARKLQNPRLLQISFHTFRHWKATMEYAKTKDILHVMRLLGHRNINNTLVYTQLIDFKEDEYVSKVAKNADEACRLVEAGFEYVCTTPENLMVFRKRK